MIRPGRPGETNAEDDDGITKAARSSSTGEWNEGSANVVVSLFSSLRTPTIQVFYKYLHMVSGHGATLCLVDHTAKDYLNQRPLCCLYGC